MKKKYPKFVVKLLIFIALQLITTITFAQNKTMIKGHIFDAKTKETIPYTNVQLDGTTIGTTSDIDGHFYIETDLPNIVKIKVSCVGYITQLIPIKTNEFNELNILLEDNTVNLTEITVRPKKYRNKGNPAVELIENVIKYKSKNRPTSLDFYSYKKHEKTSFALNNVTEKTKKSKVFRGLAFVFEKADTNKANGKVSLPLFLRESIADVYFRKSPKATKEYIRGEKMTNVDGFFDADGISDYLSNMYQNIDFYDNSIDLLTLRFISPISPIAPNIYRFYIQDTTVIDNTKCVHMYFSPRNKADLAFMGHLWVALDSSYAIRKIEAGITKDINLNWVREMQVSQQYNWVSTPSVDSNGKPQRALMLAKDEMMMDYALTDGDSIRSILGLRSVHYANMRVNEPIADELFDNGVAVWRDPKADERNEQFWQANRIDSLSTRDKNIYAVVDTLTKNDRFMFIIKGIRLIFNGFLPYKKVEFTSLISTISFNPIEGIRLRLGGRTSPLKFSQRVLLEGYGAYGMRDNRWKGMVGFSYNFGEEVPLHFPMHQWRTWAINDIRLPGLDVLAPPADNLYNSVQRAPNNKMWYIQSIGTEYLHEYRNHFSFDIGARNVTLDPAGVLSFRYTNNKEQFVKPTLTTTEFSAHIRYAPNEKFYQGATERRPIVNAYPIIDIWYTKGVKGLFNGEYNFQSVRLKAKKSFYLAPIGRADMIVEAGQVFGKVPYPLQMIHQGNQAYVFQAEPYNLMNIMEFVSDKYVSFNVIHNFGGIFLNRFPLIRKLKLREILTFKALWGGIDSDNLPNKQGDGLFDLPTDPDGTPLARSLAAKPYMEVSFGVTNLFSILRIDYVQRLSYLDAPHVSKWGIRFALKLNY